MAAVKLEQTIMTPDHRLASPVTLQNVTKGYHFSLYTLNDEDVVDSFPSRNEKMQQLHLHGLNVPSAGTSNTFIRQYVIGVFQCKAIFTYISYDKTVWLANGKLQTPERYRLVPVSGKNLETKRVERLAIRSVYALGWDYGVVRLGKATKGKSVVLDVIPRPKLNAYMTKAFQQAFERYETQITQLTTDASKLRLGTDPEFILVDANGKLKMASDYFGYRGLVGCDAIWQGANRTNKPLVEIRPRASNSPRELVIRLYRGMVYAAKKINEPDTKWLAGALPRPGLPIGGHIHFSGIPLGTAILRVLDNYLTLPLVLVEDKRGIKRRPKYGFLGDFREKYHGGFEYRTPPSWLVSPTLTKGVFSLAKLIALNYPFLTQRPLSDLRVQKAYYNGDKDTIERIVPSLWNEVTRLPEYDEEQYSLDAYYDFLMSGKTWNENEDIRRKWRIPPYHKTK